MKKSAGLLLVLSLFVFGCGAAKTPPGSPVLVPQTQMEKDLMDATVVVYDVRVNTFQGGYVVEDYDECTATAFERNGDTYRFITAAHCFDSQNIPISFCLSRDEMSPIYKPDEETLFTAELRLIGSQYFGQDLAVIESKMPGVDMPIMPLALSDAEIGDNVSNVAATKFGGKQLYRGVVVDANFQETIFGLSGAVWRNATIVRLGKGSARPGMSGSAIISENKGGIAAILVGSAVWNKTGIALPISQFKKFWKSYLDRQL